MRPRPTRLDHVAGFNIDTVAAAAGDDPDTLRLENLDTDLLPPAAAIEATRAAVGLDSANSYFFSPASWLPRKPSPPLSPGGPAPVTTRRRKSS